MADKLKQERSKNISIVELCDIYRRINENKKTDECMVKEKDECWMRIAAEFNST